MKIKTEISNTDIQEFLDWVNRRAFCNSGQHIVDRIATIFQTQRQATPAEDRYSKDVEWICSRCGHRNVASNEVCMGAEMGDGRCGKPKSELKLLAQYLDEYIEHEIDLCNIDSDASACHALWRRSTWRELLEQALDAYESTESVRIKIEKQ